MNRRANWWLVAAGAVLGLCGAAILVVPGLVLKSLSLWSGVAFLVSGALGIVSYARVRRGREGAAWSFVMAAFDMLVGVLLAVHPVLFADMAPGILGIAFAAFGVVEIVGMMPFAKLADESRIIAIISGVLSVALGVMFAIWPSSLPIWVAAFAIVRSITLIAMGLTTRLR